jgi:hypothetical protein
VTATMPVLEAAIAPALLLLGVLAKTGPQHLSERTLRLTG